MRVDLPQMKRIEKIMEEAKGIRSFVFKGDLGSKPGQFVMMWIPGMDAKPMSVSYDDGQKFVITLSGVGPFSKKVYAMKAGEQIGIMGPYGTWFSMKGENVVMVGGGYGSGPLTFLAEERKKVGKESHLIIGARTKDLILFRNRTKRAGIKTYYSTNDGSFGFKGFNTKLLEEFVTKNHIDRVLTCGPELMMKGVLDICLEYNVPCEVSIERYMKCGIGICGTCCVDPLGIRMCVEGPVVDGEIAKKVFEFGKYHRDKYGIKHEFGN